MRQLPSSLPDLICMQAIVAIRPKHTLIFPVVLTMSSPDPKTLIQALLKAIEDSIIPLTREGVSSGLKVFGAAILDRNLKPLTVATNDERISPLLQGEINCIQLFFTRDYPDPATRPSPQTDCIFFATHEPCSMCLSGLTWAGFKELYYLFTYEDSRDLFSIPYDIDILEQVFRVQGHETDGQVKEGELYNRRNKFFKAKSVAYLVATIHDEGEGERLLAKIQRIKQLYSSLSQIYQERKTAGAESSSFWK